MKLRSILYLTIASVIVFTGCQYDNFDPPESDLVGRIVYNGESIEVKNNDVELELWQDGFELREKIPVYIAQDGSFSAKLFDGEYKLTMLQGDGPWVSTADTVTINLNGYAEVDFEVEPYYILNNVEISNSSGDINAVFDVEEIAGGRDIEFVALYVGTTTIIDNIFNDGNSTTAVGAAGDLPGESLTFTLGGDLAERDYIFTRIGVKTVGVTDLIFSPVQKIEL